MSHVFVPPTFLGSRQPDDAAIALFGVCWDGTSSFKAGSRFAGFAVREASYGIEDFSMHQEASILDVPFADLGDLFLPPGQRDRVLADIGTAVAEVRGRGQFPLAFGGEHLVAYPLIAAAFEAHPDLAVVHMDAHADLRTRMWHDPWTHATVLGRVADLVGWHSLKQFGIRSCGREELELARRHDTLRPFTPQAIQEHLDSLGDRPIYLTLDMDVLDPSIYPGTGTPEPGGITWTELLEGLRCLEGRRLVGMDCLELAPHYDPSGVSAMAMAKTLRELLILADRRKR